MYRDMIERGQVHEGGYTSTTSSSGNDNDNDSDSDSDSDSDNDIAYIYEERVTKERHDGHATATSPPSRRVIVDSSHHLHRHMMSVDRELALFPQRSFTFGEVRILLDQSIADVGCTVWDAEIILAHYINEMRERISNTHIAELGAGTALAGILCGKLRARAVTLQELDSCIEHTRHCCSMNFHDDDDDDGDRNVTKPRCIAHKWSTACGEILVQQNDGMKYDFVIMADVLYHCEDFSMLIETIMKCLCTATGEVIICYEQRRRDLSEFFRAMLDKRLVLVNAIQEFIIEDDSLSHESTTTKYYLYHFKSTDHGSNGKSKSRSRSR